MRFFRVCALLPWALTTRALSLQALVCRLARSGPLLALMTRAWRGEWRDRFPWIRRRSARMGDVGRWGEWWAARVLRRHGYRVLRKRWSDGVGELDLIAWRGGKLIFVEVKARRAGEFVSEGPIAALAGLEHHALVAVDEEKRRRVTRASLRFLTRHDLLGYPCRFDIVTVVAGDPASPIVRHWAGAFEATGDQQSMF